MAQPAAQQPHDPHSNVVSLVPRLPTLGRPLAWTPETKPLWLIDNSADEPWRTRRLQELDSLRSRPKPQRTPRHRAGDYDDGSADVPMFTADECSGRAVDQ